MRSKNDEKFHVFCAINQTIAKGDATDLKFEVNGEEVTKAEFDETYGEEDYTVNFLYNFADATDTERAGKVSKENPFKYAIQVYLDGEKVNEVKAADYADVKVVKKSNAVKVHELGLFDGEKEFEHDTVLTADKVEIGASVYENALGQKNTDKNKDGSAVAVIDAPEVKKVTSSAPTVAYYGTDGIVVRKDGEVTFTVEFEDDKLEVLQKTIKVTTRAEQKLTSVEAKDLRVEAGKDVEIELKQLDQDGNKMREDETVYYTSTEDGKVEAKEAKVLPDELKFTKGNHTVKLYADEKMKTALGSFAVEAVDVSADVEIDDYKIVADKNPEQFKDDELKDLDLNEDAGLNELVMLVEAYKDGIKVDLDSTVNLVAESSDTDVVTINGDGGVDAEGNFTIKSEDKTGEATVTLYIVEGDYREEVATYDVEVVNTTAQINNLELAEGVKTLDVVEDKSKDSGWDVYNLDQLVSSDLDKKDDEKTNPLDGKIEKVEFSANDGKAIVTIADINGGKEFTFDAADQATVKDETEFEIALADPDVKNVVLGDDINLEGANYTITKENVVIDGDGYALGSPQLRVNGNGITIKNLEQGDTVLRIVITATDVKIIDNKLNGGDAGVAVYFNKTSSGEVEGNTIVTEHKGIGADTTEKVTIKDNIITATSDAIELFNGSGQSVEEAGNYNVSGNTIN